MAVGADGRVRLAPAAVHYASDEVEARHRSHRGYRNRRKKQQIARGDEIVETSRRPDLHRSVLLRAHTDHARFHGAEKRGGSAR